MEFFTNLPAEKIEEICLKLDNKSLSRFMQTSKRIHNICYDMYLKKEEEHKIRKEEEQKILDALAKIRDRSPENMFIYISFDEDGLYVAEASFYGARDTLTYPEAILISDYNIVGWPDAIRLYLFNIGIRPSTIDQIMSTAKEEF